MWYLLDNVLRDQRFIRVEKMYNGHHLSRKGCILLLCSFVVLGFFSDSHTQEKKARERQR